MRLSRLYTNSDDVFAPIDFTPGLNVVIAEIRLPSHSERDTHNLGKSTLGKVIDFCLLKGTDSTLFLIKHKDLFGDLTFFLELELIDGGFVTIRRDVMTHTRIWFKLHEQGGRDFGTLAESEWDHVRVPFAKSVEMLDGWLDLSDLKPWSYRSLVGYLIRGQSDYQDVFQLTKLKGAESEWKPFLAQILGFDAARLVAHYRCEIELETVQGDESVVKRELGGSVDDLSEIEGLLLIRQAEIADKSQQLECFDFERADAEKTRIVVDELDASIGQLNSDRYRLSHELKKLRESLLDDKILFNPKEAEAIFDEVGVVFDGQLKKDFVQLLAFNRAITEERRGYLVEEIDETQAALMAVQGQLTQMESARGDALVFLADMDSLAKYKSLSDDMVGLRADVLHLERQRVGLARLQELRSKIQSLGSEVAELKAKVIEDVEAQSKDHGSTFSAIRMLFNGIVQKVISRQALILAKPNRLGHLDFQAEIYNERGEASDADAGCTYRKLLCIALDLAVLRARLDGKCSRFVFHDGVFESLDDRKKENLLAVMRDYAQAGVQQVITLIEADLPHGYGSGSVFEDGEIVLRLHDDGDDGRLFKMPAW